MLFHGHLNWNQPKFTLLRNIRILVFFLKETKIDFEFSIKNILFLKENISFHAKTKATIFRFVSKCSLCMETNHKFPTLQNDIKFNLYLVSTLQNYLK